MESRPARVRSRHPASSPRTRCVRWLSRRGHRRHRLRRAPSCALELAAAARCGRVLDDQAARIGGRKTMHRRIQHHATWSRRRLPQSAEQGVARCRRSRSTASHHLRRRRTAFSSGLETTNRTRAWSFCLPPSQVVHIPRVPNPGRPTRGNKPPRLLPQSSSPGPRLPTMSRC